MQSGQVKWKNPVKGGSIGFRGGETHPASQVSLPDQFICYVCDRKDCKTAVHELKQGLRHREQTHSGHYLKLYKMIQKKVQKKRGCPQATPLHDQNIFPTPDTSSGACFWMYGAICVLLFP